MPKQTRKACSTRFGELLKDARLKSGLTNEQFAALLELPYVTIWRYEHNKRTPTLNNAEWILKKLGLTMAIGKEQITFEEVEK